MISSLINIGMRELNGDYSKENVLKKISISPPTFLVRKDSKKYEKVPSYPLVLDFDLIKKEVEIRRGQQFRKNENYFIFPKLAPNAKRISFNTDTFYPHLFESEEKGPTPFGIIKYSKEKGFELSEEFKDCLDKLKQFYKPFKIKKKEGFILNPEYLTKNNKEDFNWTGEVDLITKAYEGLISKILGRDKETKGKIFSMIYINGQTIFNTKFAKEYQEMLYYAYIIDSKFDKKNIKKDKICYYCGKKGNVTNNVQTPFKFYITDKPGFFENLKQSKAYKSFNLCEKCYIDLICGINKVKSELHSQFSGINFIMIPKSEEFFEDFSNNVDYLNEIVNSEIKGSSIMDINKIVKESLKYNYLIDFLFYIEKNSSFKVIKSISDVEFKSILKIRDLLDMINYEIEKEFPKLKINDINLSTFRIIFLSNLKDKDNYSKYILFEILDAIYKSIPVEPEWFFENFLSNYKRGYFDDKKRENGYFLTFQTLFLYEFLIKLGLIEVKKMEMEVFSDIKNEKLKGFFEKHKEIDEFRKGLVIIGMLADEIARKQFDDKKSSTFLNKINYDGTDKPDLSELITEIEKYFRIYKLYESPDLKTFAFETASKYIKSSYNVNPQEVTFYILLGVNLDRYLANEYSDMKKNNEKEGEENGE